MLLDTSFMIALLNNDSRALSLIPHLDTYTLHLSIVTFAEIHLGFSYLVSESNKQKQYTFDSFLKERTAVIIPFEENIAKYYAKIQSELLHIGQSLSRFDAIIASTAIVHNLTLVTLDKDFERVPGLQLFKK